MRGSFEASEGLQGGSSSTVNVIETEHRTNSNHTHRSNERKKTARLAQHHVQRIERRKQLEAERQEKERLKALKENNEEEYLRLLAQTKNRRLQQLLQQTDEYLASIGAKVVAERNKLTESVGGNVDALLKGGLDDAEEVKPVPGDQAMDQNAIEQLKKNQQNYYTLTHAKEEEVTEQPEMLIGGSLKSYQVWNCTEYCSFLLILVCSWRACVGWCRCTTII